MIHGQLARVMLAIVLAGAIMPGIAGAQSGNYYIRGTVTYDGVPAVGAHVTMDKCSYVTDSNGRFFLDFQYETVVPVTVAYKGQNVTRTAYMPSGGGIVELDFDLHGPSPSPAPSPSPTLTPTPTPTLTPTVQPPATVTATGRPSAAVPSSAGGPNVFYWVPTLQLIGGLAMACVFYVRHKKK